MTILQSLNRAYDRLALRHEVPSFGFSSEKISFCLSLNADGTLAGPPIDLRDSSGKKPAAQFSEVPSPPKRANGIAPCFLWDKSSYVLGISADEKKLKDDAKRLNAEHEAFKDFHIAALTGTDDEGLKALQRFLESWKPDTFDSQPWPEGIKTAILDQNVAFALESQRLDKIYLHDRLAAKRLWAKMASDSEGGKAICLVSGEEAPIARLHPSIKGIWGGQSSGGSIVSFNADAYESYGHKQGDNAPVSEAAAFGYTTALNKYLEKGSANRIQIGDTSTVFWADASDVDGAKQAEAVFANWWDDTSMDEAAEAKNAIRPILEKIRAGQPLADFAPALSNGVRFYVLGLAPNAARISIRFWCDNDFGELTQHYQRFLADMAIEPPDRDEHIALWKYLRETAVLGKSENVAPNLAGEWMRSILAGTSYPLPLLPSILTRIRADGEINARRISILKALLRRNFNFSDKEAPVAFDPGNDNKGYLLGRLFALYEQVQAVAQDYKINASVKDKFYSSASSQPRKVFALLERGSANHLSKIGKQRPGQKVNLEKQIAEIMDRMSPSVDPFPIALSPNEQALFGLGYYHQRSEFFKKPTDTKPSEETA